MTVNGGARDTVSGGSGGLDYRNADGGANDVTTAAGSSSVLDVANDAVHSFGSDTIRHRGGNVSMDVHGDSALRIDDGNSSFSLYGRTSVTVAAGYDRFTLAPGADASFDVGARGGLASIREDGASARVLLRDPGSLGAEPAAVSVSGGSADIAANPGYGISVSTSGAAPVSVTASSGPVSVSSSGADAVRLGSGPSYVAVLGDGAEVWAGSGDLRIGDYDWSGGGSFTLHGGSGSVSADAGSARMSFVGGSGDAVLTGEALDIVGGSGSVSVTGRYGSHVASFTGGSGAVSLALDGSGSDITFGSGAASVHALGWGASDVFRFAAGQAGTSTIDNFRVGTDAAVLGAGVSVASADAAGGSARFVLSSGATVTFNGVADTRGVFG